MFIVSFLVVAVTDQLEFNTMEDRAYNLLVRLLLKKQIKQEAVDVLQSAFLHKNEYKKAKAKPNNQSKVLKFFRLFRSDMIKFRLTANKLTTHTLNSIKADNTTIIQNMADSAKDHMIEIEESHKRMDDNVVKILECIRNKEYNKRNKLNDLQKNLTQIREVDENEDNKSEFLPKTHD